MIKKITSRWIGRYWWIGGLIIFFTIAAAFFDIRFLFVTLIELLIIAPMSIVNVWLGYSTKPSVVQSIYPQKITLTDTALVITYIENENFLHIPSSVNIPKSRLKVTGFDKKYLTMTYGKRLEEMVIIPAEALNQEFCRELFPSASAGWK